MKTKAILLASSAAVALSLAAPANAAGWYVAAFGGANWSDDDSFSVATGPAPADTLTWATDSDTGFIVGGAIGLSLNQFVSGLRAEIELAYRENDVDGLWVSSTGVASSTGGLQFDQQTFSVLANVWYDFQLAGVSPYVGGGIGWADTDIDGNYFGGIATPLKFSDDGFAWQVGAGINFDVSPNMKLGVGYRYFEGPDVTVGAPFAGNVAASDFENQNHTALVTLTVGM